MVWAAAGRPAGLLPRLLCDGAEPGWLAARMSSAMQNYWTVLLLLLHVGRKIELSILSYPALPQQCRF